jgi:ornithine carbamoyltransferase
MNALKLTQRPGHTGKIAMRHFLDLLDVDADELTSLLKEALKLKKAHLQGRDKPTLARRVLGLVFEKPSLRTRVSFQAAMAQLGGASIFLGVTETGLGQRESIPDFARTLSQYVDGVVLRTFAHQTVETFARYATCPVINGLSDYYHPCQALGDLLTLMEEFGDPRDHTLVFVGDGNNVARSLAIGCAKLGIRFVLAAPEGYRFDRPFVEIYRRHFPATDFVETGDAKKAVRNADAIYTDVWASMGQEKESGKRRKAFAAYQVNSELLKHAPAHVRIMHCLPAHRGEEISDDVLDSSASIVFPQAGNRMHAQKALLQRMLGKHR